SHAQALCGADGLGRGRRERRRPRAARERRVADADAAGKARDHLRRDDRARRFEGAAGDPRVGAFGVSTPRFAALALALFTALTAVMTWPQVAHMRDGVHDPGDPLMVTWVLAWVAHQLPRAPAHLFDANIFYPERNTLAYSDTLVVPGAVAAPLQWAGVHPVVVYYLAVLSAFACSALGAP